VKKAKNFIFSLRAERVLAIMINFLFYFLNIIV